MFDLDKAWEENKDLFKSQIRRTDQFKRYIKRKRYVIDQVEYTGFNATLLNNGRVLVSFHVSRPGGGFPPVMKLKQKISRLAITYFGLEIANVQIL